MPMEGKFKRPTKTEQEEKRWPFGHSSGGHTKGIIRTKIRNIEGGKPYTLRVSVIQQESGDDLTLELHDMIATHDPDLDF